MQKLSDIPLVAVAPARGETDCWVKRLEMSVQGWLFAGALSFVAACKGLPRGVKMFGETAWLVLVTWAGATAASCEPGGTCTDCLLQENDGAMVPLNATARHARLLLGATGRWRLQVKSILL